MTTFTIREANDIEEIEHFQLYDDANQGDDILVAELNNKVVGFIQFTGTTIYFVESDSKGAGRALVNYVLDGADFAIADNVHRNCEGFWAKMGFQPDPVYNGWTWYAE